MRDDDTDSSSVLSSRDWLEQIFPRIPNRYVGRYHKDVVTLVVIADLVLFTLACNVSPGKITKENVDEFDNYELDGA